MAREKKMQRARTRPHMQAQGLQTPSTHQVNGGERHFFFLFFYFNLSCPVSFNEAGEASINPCVPLLAGKGGISRPNNQLLGTLSVGFQLEVAVFLRFAGSCCFEMQRIRQKGEAVQDLAPVARRTSTGRYGGRVTGIEHHLKSYQSLFLIVVKVPSSRKCAGGGTKPTPGRTSIGNSFLSLDAKTLGRWWVCFPCMHACCGGHA